MKRIGAGTDPLTEKCKILWNGKVCQLNKQSDVIGKKKDLEELGALIRCHNK